MSSFFWPFDPRRRWHRLVARILDLQPRYESLDDAAILRESRSLRYRARSGEAMDRLLPEAFALIREAAWRVRGMRHYGVQLTGGVALHHGCIAEMQTGEGKTLTATLPIYLAALEGCGAHLATANDYLAIRDAELMGPVYQSLGLQVGVVQSQTPKPQRRKAYRCDITYGTAKEFGFDFLRDRLARGRLGEQPSELLQSLLMGAGDGNASDSVQQPLHFVLVDEADSILIDEARTPLIVSAAPGPGQQRQCELYRWAAQVAQSLREGEDYQYEATRATATLTPGGRRLLREGEKPHSVEEADWFEIYERVETALCVNQQFVRDRHYIVRDGQIVIVDEFTGRLAEGRKWREGVHQAVEAREGLEITVPTGEAARVTMQDFFLHYRRRAGMTGTAADARSEFQRIYEMPVSLIPTHRPPRRRRLPDAIYGSGPRKWQAIVEEIVRLHRAGRPVLIGTRTIDKSEQLADLLRATGIDFEVLNARQNADEARIVAQAGHQGRVTVATNMAGRGTDISLSDEVQALGGMHVMGSELHESRRIDRQLSGRCGRQGDPGSYRQFMALDDELLLTAFGPRRYARLCALGRSRDGEMPRFARLFRQAQRLVERRHFRQRKALLYREQQRKEIQQEMGQDPYLDAA